MMRYPYLADEPGKCSFGYKEPVEITLIYLDSACFYRHGWGGEHLDPTDSYRLISMWNKCYPISLNRSWTEELTLRIFAKVHK
jgi:hypothetical protein